MAGRMSAIGDQLREFVAICDAHPEFVAFGTIIVPGEAALNFMCESPTTAREAFERVQRAIGGAQYPAYVDDKELERILRDDDKAAFAPGTPD